MIEYHVCHKGSGTTRRLTGPKQLQHQPQCPISSTLSSAPQTVRGVPDLQKSICFRDLLLD